MLKKGKTAKAKIKLELLDKTKIEVISYNEIADYCFQNINNKDVILIYGIIHTNEVECRTIERLK